MSKASLWLSAEPSFLAGLAFALAFADRGRRTDLFAQLLNDNTVDRFSAEVKTRLLPSSNCVLHATI